MDLISYWGAVTGTIGTITSVYSIWLNKKSKIPKIIIDNPVLIIHKDETYGTSIKFKLGLSNAGSVPVSVNRFKIDFGFILPDKFYSLFNRKKIERQLELTHTIPTGSKLEGEIIEKPQRGQSIFLQPGTHFSTIYTDISIFWEHQQENKNYPFFENLVNPLLKGNYKIIYFLSNNKKVSIKGLNIKKA